jgi:DNA-binding MarR family transcriptional regulator
MPQANTLPGAPTGVRPPPTGAAPEAVDQIQASLQIVASSITQVRVHERLLQSAGVRLDRAGAAALYKLHRHDDAIRITTLAEMLGVDAPTVTRKVQQLERDGLVVRHADPDDGRASRIALTPAGRRTLERVLKARRAWLERLLEGWDDEDLARFGSLLGRFSAALERDMEDARGS